MLKEMTLLVIVLWGSQGMPTPPTQPQQNLRLLNELYCEAEGLLRGYKLIDKKYLSSEAKAKMTTDFSQPGCNITKSGEEEEECQIHQDFKQLFGILGSTHQQDELLKPVKETFSKVMDLQNKYVNHTCLEGASDKMPQLDCPKYGEEGEKPSRENMLHYIFDLYKTLLHKLLSSKFKLDKSSSNEVCQAKGN